MVYLLIFMSGCAGLIYEILWIKRAALSFGSSSLAMATVLAVFFLGLGLGSHLFGRKSRSMLQPLRLCAVLECVLAINGLLNPWLFAWADDVYGLAYRHFALDSASLQALRGLLVAILLLPPTLLMGGTLPLFCRHSVRQPAHIATSIGRLYAINTLGATVGCAVAGFVLLPEFGITKATWFAAGFNLLAGFGFFRLAATAESLPLTTVDDAPSTPRQETVRNHYFWVGGLFFMIGTVALANELLWARYLNNIIRNSVYTYTITLMVVLAGTVLGSLFSAPLYDRTKSRASLLLWFAMLQAASASLTLVLTHLPVQIWQTVNQYGVLPYMLLMLAPATIAGASFPLANRMIITHTAQASQLVGSLTAVNILGCVVGSLLTGFWLLPAFGLNIGIYTATGCGLLTAVLALLAAGRAANSSSRQPWAGWAIVCTCTLLWLFMPRLLPVRVPEDFIAHADPLLDFAEGYNATLAVVEHGGGKTLLVNRAWQGSENKNHQIMAAHIPMFHYPDAKDVLVVGLGVGQTASRFLDYGIERLDIVDIEPRLFEFVRNNFPSAWMDDPRVQLISEDGRGYVKHTDRQYDLLAVEVGQLYRPGVDVFYTREFYQEAHRRLRSDGMVVQFVPLEFLRPKEFASVLKTFLEVFPDAKLWYNTSELLLMGFKDRQRTLSADGVRQTLAQRKIHDDLAYAYWGGPGYHLNQFPVLLSGFLASGQALHALAAADGAAVYTDDWPWLAYSVSDFQVADLRAVELAKLIRTRLSPLEEAVSPGSADAEELRRASEIRHDNTGDLAAANILELAGHAAVLIPPEPFVASAGEALQWNPHNLTALKLMGSALIQANRAPEALDYLHRAFEMDPGDAIINKQLGFALARTGKMESAKPHLASALQSLPDDGETMNTMAIVLVNLQRVDEAIPYFRRAAELEPGNPAAQRNLQAAESYLRH